MRKEQESIMEYESIKDIKTSQYVMRYIVPFSFGAESEDAYKTACEILIENENWMPQETDTRDGDCFSYMYALYSFGNENAIGSIWNYRIKKASSKAEMYIRYKNNNQELYAKITDCGLFLLKQGIGLLWYEIVFVNHERENITDKTEIDINSIIEFQYLFKEIARSDKNFDLVWIKKRSFKESEIVDYKQVEYEDLIDAKKIKRELKELSSNNGYLKIHQIDAVKITIAECIVERLKDLTEPEQMEKCTIKFYPERRRKDQMLPDKAILYNYAAVKEQDIGLSKQEYLKQMGYYLASGYKQNYKMAAEVEQRMYHPFQNMVWYAQKEGCSVCAYTDETNETFYKDTMKNRVKRDYFLLYMNLLQQSYALLNMAEEITTVVSVNEKDYLCNTPKLMQNLEKIQARIHVFIVKNIYASVSHIGHHNKFYEYVETQMRIKKDVESLRDGLEVLESLHRRNLEKIEKQEREKEEEREKRSADKMENAFAILTIISILIMPKDIWEMIGDLNFDLVHIISIIFCVILFLLVFVSSRDSLKTLFLSLKEEKEDFKKILKNKKNEN